MTWKKLGRIFKTEVGVEWMVSHAQVPVVHELPGGRWRIYFGTRDKENRTTTTFIEVEASNPTKVLRGPTTQALGLGKLGCFDDSGAMPSWIARNGDRLFLYYIGWNVGITVPYRNSVGLAISDNGGTEFRRAFDGPILDRTEREPYLCASSCVLFDGGVWRMWYLSGTGWGKHSGRVEPYYHIKYAESENGIEWRRDGIVCIDYDGESEGGIARPSVLKDNGVYKMWYSHRGRSGFRERGTAAYRLGYAESPDGLKWSRRDSLAGLDVSDTGWDSEMIAYPFVTNLGGRTYLFYNGNGFGHSGIGCAVWEP